MLYHSVVSQSSPTKCWHVNGWGLLKHFTSSLEAHSKGMLMGGGNLGIYSKQTYV